MPEFPFSMRRVAVFAGIIVLILIMVELNSRLEELNRLNDQLDQVRVAATHSVQTQVALQTQLAYADSTQAVEEWARTEGHYMKEGDQPVVPIGQPGSDPIVIATPTPMPTPMQNWQVWWGLFFSE
ncbi:MAG: hypothetical protein JNM55_18885 [Anaerolineales bacterium]|nr:hypothetical protein [Anaerolineales bacterium]